MRRLFAILLLLRAGTALAAPFDTYQLIMWQERTPAQLDGLKQLGFTGTKLRATGGQIDPAELAAHVASGLPWFLENIATDFYAPYHRYTPGKVRHLAVRRRQGPPPARPGRHQRLHPRPQPLRPGLAGPDRRPAAANRPRPVPLPPALL